MKILQWIKIYLEKWFLVGVIYIKEIKKLLFLLLQVLKIKKKRAVNLMQN